MAQAQRFIPNWFVALPVPADGWLQEITGNAPAEIRPFVPEDVHLTVAFFGAMHPAKKLDIIQLMDEIRFEPFAISFAHLRPLPSEKFPTALSFELARGHDEAVQIMEQWRDRLTDCAGVRRESRAPLPHVTIARPQRKFGAAGRRAALAWAAGVGPPSVEPVVDSIALYTWAVDRHRRQFDIVYGRSMNATGAP